MADEINLGELPTVVGNVDIPAKSVGRGTISVGDYVSFVGEDGMEQFGTVSQLVPSESGWLLQVVPDGGDVPMDLAVGDVKKAKRPVGDGAMTEPAAPLEGPNAEVVASLLAKLVAEFGQFIQSPDGTLVEAPEAAEAAPAEGAAPAAEDVAVGPVVDDMVTWMDDAGAEKSGVVVALMDGDTGQIIQVDPGDGVVVEVPVELVTVVPAEEPVAEVVEEVPVEVPAEVPMAARGRRRSFARGAPIRGEGGRFGGSEPGDGGDESGGGDGGDGGSGEGGGDNPFTSGDRMADVLPASGDQFASEEEAGAVAEVIAAGGDIMEAAGGPMDMTSEDIDSINQAHDMVEEAMQPAPAGVEVYTMGFVSGRYSLNPETGEVTREGADQPEANLQGVARPQDTGQFMVGSGDPSGLVAVAGATENVFQRGDGSIGRQQGQQVPIKVTVPEGHPMVNAGRDNDVNPSSDTNVVLSRDTGLRITGFGVDAATGTPMFTAEAFV